MANNVDLVVVGTSDGVSATELTQRLVVEFGQPETAFTDLVAAACGSGSSYMAQTKVSLDTAVEGQIQLEKLGVVCQVLMDGEVMGESASAVAANDSAPDAIPAAPEITAVEDSDSQLDLAIEAESIEAMPETDDAELIDLMPETDKPDDQLLADEFDNSDVSFGDESGLPGDSGTSGSASSDKSNKLEGKPATDNELGFEDVSFSEELGSLDDEIQKTRNKIKAEKEQAKKPAQAEPEVASETATEKPENTDSGESADLALDDEDNAKPAVESKTDGELDLELSLSVDDSVPLTKPKVKSDKVADDGGLTLSLDDDTPLTSPKKATAKAKPEPLDATLSLDEDPEPESKSTPSADMKVEIAAEPASETTAESGDSQPAIEARDTSREPEEKIAPLLDEPEPEPQPEPKQEPVQPTGTEQLEDVQAPSQSDGADQAEVGKADQLAAVEKTITEPAAGKPDVKAPPVGGIKLDSLIDDLAAGATKEPDAVEGGLVLPGQAASDESPAVVDVQGGSEQTPQAKQAVQSEGADVQQPPSPDASDSAEVGRLKGDAADNDRSEEVDIVFENDEIKLKRVKLIKTAVAASVMITVLGGGAAFYMSSQQGTSGTVVPVVAQVAPANDKSALEAVEEGSLNAALKRSSDISSPDSYSTEDLIVYLSDDLGDNARQELQNYVSGDGPYVVGSQSMPRLGAAIPADSNSVLWLKNRVAHEADKYFDEWSKREVDLQAYLELQARLIEVGDHEIARDVSSTTKDKLFAVMSLQLLARAYNDLGQTDKALDALEQAARATYSIQSEAERTIAIADFALSEKELGREEDSLDSFLKASILARSLHKPESRTVSLTAIAGYYQQVGRVEDMTDYLGLAMTTAYELPVNTAARDLAIRHVALAEVRLGLAAQATDHANLIVDPFAAVSALHGIALELERRGDQTNARLTLNMAYRAGSLIKNSEKREKLLEKIKLAGG